MRVRTTERSGIARDAALLALSVLALFLGVEFNAWRAATPATFRRFQRDAESLVVGRLVQSRQAGLLGRIIPLSPLGRLRVFHGLMGLLAAIVLTAVAWWFRLEFGWASGGLVLVSILLSRWLTLFGRNPWWNLWAFYVPMLALACFLRRSRNAGLCHPGPGTSGRRRFVALGVVAGISTLVKCLFTGYEYITTSLIMMAVPFIYYAVLARSAPRLLLKTGATIAAGALAAVALTVLVLLVQVASVEGGPREAVTQLTTTMANRTYGHAVDFPGEFSASLQARPGGVIATWFSILAPLSWFIVFKSHSYIHTHINFVVWQMPFTLFGFATWGVVAGLAWRRLAGSRPAGNRPATERH